MKKIVIVGLAALIAAFYTTSPIYADEVLVGISKIVAHPALDALEQGVQDGVKESFPKAKFDLQNANGEISTASQIAQKFKAQNVDVAVGIATPTAQALVNAMKKRPVVFCAVTDPVGAGLVKSVETGQPYVTGTSDMTPVRQQIEMLVRLAGVKTLGHVYTSSEANAVKLARIAKQVCKDLGIGFVESTVTNSSEVKQATQAIIKRVDGIYLSNDNTVFSALGSVLGVANKNKVPVMSADPSSAKDNPVFAAWGFDYYKMGVATGKIVARVLNGENPADIPTKFMTDPSDVTLIVNLDVADKIGVKIPQDVLDAATVIRNGKTVN
ncbi:MAG: ABC transporter substrate-binding protein [Desulfobacterales bacterium]|nr:ABC transporter substrate-binding protein [Desulfobacterales bacterium]